MKAIKMDDSNSVLINTGKGFNVWVDVYEDGGEIQADWNKYIFFLDNPEDVRIRDFQDDCENFDLATSIAISFYEHNRN